MGRAPFLKAVLEVRRGRRLMTVLPPLVAHLLRRAEVDADDHVDLSPEGHPCAAIEPVARRRR
jgi:hypothetical protein